MAMTLRLTAELEDRLDERSRLSGVPKHTIVVRALEDALTGRDQGRSQGVAAASRSGQGALNGTASSSRPASASEKNLCPSCSRPVKAGFLCPYCKVAA